MRRYVFLIAAFFGAAVFLGELMGVKTVSDLDFDKIIGELRSLDNKSLIVGVQAAEGSHLAKYAGANEFGAEIKAKNGKFIAIPLVPEAKGRSPREFGERLFYIPGKHAGYGFLALDDGNRIKRYYILKKWVRIPERAFLRTTMNRDSTRKHAQENVSKNLTELLESEKTANDVLNALGGSLQSAVKSTIGSNLAPENSPLTRALKVTNKTLIDSGDLLKSIGYEIIG